MPFIQADAYFFGRVACPHCDAKPGEWCKSPKGKPLYSKGFHSARKRVAWSK